MATHDMKLGIGLSTGMFYHAPSGTALPTTPGATLGSSWTLVGDVTDAGITVSMSRDTTPIKNWANKVKRVIQTGHTETIKAPIQDTTDEVFKTILGSDNVTVTPASSAHGKLVKADLAPDSMPEEEAFLFLMKDDDDLIAIGCTKGQITALEDVAFAPNAGITWTPTITAIEGFSIITDDGQVTGATGATGGTA